MIRLLQPPSDHGYFSWFSAWGGPQGSVSFGFLLGPFSPQGPPSLGNVLYSTDGLLVPDAKSKWRMREKGVEHYQYDGDITLPGFPVIPDADPNEWQIYHSKNKKGVNKYFTHIVFQDTVLRCSARVGNVTFHFLVEWSGRHLRYGYCAQTDGRNDVVAWMELNEFSPNYKKRATRRTSYTRYGQWSKDRVWPSAPYASSFSLEYFVEVPVDPQKILIARRTLEDFLGIYPLKYYPGDDYAFGDLAQDCMDQLRATSVNTLTYLGEMSELKALIPKFQGWRNPRTYANAWLCFKYGLRLTVADTKALHAAYKATLAMKHTPHRETYASRFTTGKLNGATFQDEYHYKLITYPYDNFVMGMIRRLDSWGLAPTGTRIWDALPFSFVLDWVLDVSSLLERADTATMALYYDVMAVTRSRKVSNTLSASQLDATLPWVGLVTCSWYHREVSDKISLPIPKFDGKQTEFSNFAELTSLIVVLSK